MPSVELCYNILMDNLEYLKHISQSNRPVKQSKLSKINGKLILRILVSGVLIAAILIGIGAIMNNKSHRALDVSQQLYLKMNNVNGLISTYNKDLKSSQMRAINYSLSGILTSTMPQLASYISLINPNVKNPTAPPEKLANEETRLMGESTNILERAKLNGTLDRNYLTQIHMQLSLMMSLTSEALKRDDDQHLNAILGNFYSNLNVIEQSLDAHSSK